MNGLDVVDVGVDELATGCRRLGIAKVFLDLVPERFFGLGNDRFALGGGGAVCVDEGQGGARNDDPRAGKERTGDEAAPGRSRGKATRMHDLLLRQPRLIGIGCRGRAVGYCRTAADQSGIGASRSTCYYVASRRAGDESRVPIASRTPHKTSMPASISNPTRSWSTTTSQMIPNSGMR